MNIKDLELYPHRAGFQHKKLFENGYGVSVIPEADGETYEVAVFQHYNGRHVHVCFSTDITDDVIRYCTVDTVDSLIERIFNLPPHNIEIQVND